MKTKLTLLLVIISIVVSVLPYNLCYAAEPELKREYISRLSDGQKSYEEKLSVKYGSLSMESGDYYRISFYDGEDNLLREVEMDFDIMDFRNNGFSLPKQSLVGCEYILIEIFGLGYDYDGIKMPLIIK